MVNMDELDELRLKIAKAKGWTLWRNNEALFLFMRDKNNPASKKYCDQVDYDEAVVDDFILRHSNVPNWPRDIAAAWELVWEMNNAELPVEVRSFVDRTATCTVNEDWGNRSIGETVPEAICRAWLAWRESQA